MELVITFDEGEQRKPGDMSPRIHQLEESYPQGNSAEVNLPQVKIPTMKRRRGVRKHRPNCEAVSADGTNTKGRGINLDSVLY